MGARIMSNVIAGILLWLCFVSPLSPIQAQVSRATLQQISADNTARDLGNGRWYWTVFIKPPPDILDQIESVEYTLHPTFANPVQRVYDKGRDPNQAFPFSAAGWGVFTIKIRVFTKDGQYQDLTHYLHFGP
jgi:transcription initiation factor IIF auxiliary subunit